VHRASRRFFSGQTNVLENGGFHATPPISYPFNNSVIYAGNSRAFIGGNTAAL
jgi:hypothetical protein